jgi:predicted DNA-binding transcriptional regulator AlpA
MELELVGTHEIAETLAVSRQRVDELARTHADFPKPIAVLAAGRIWRKEDIVAWADRWERRRGRPPSGD